MTTNDFLDDMIDDINDDENKINDTNITHNDEYILKKKICAYNTNEFDDLFDEVSDTIDNDYESTKNTKSKTKITSHSKTSNYIGNKSLYVQQVLNIKSIFSYRKQLGKGGTCRVILVRDKNNNKQYALKELSKSDKYNEELFAKEVQLLQLLTDNKNILDYYNSYQTKDCYYLASAYCSGGTFLDRILKMKVFSEKIAVKYIYTILSTIDYMHSKNIVHRDLKLNNIVFDTPNENGILKIIDFGDSDIVENNKNYKELVGTLYYLSPECKRIRKGWEVKKSDMWSIGVMCYILLSGKLPFSGNTQEDTFKLIEKGIFEWPKNIQLSKCCKQFINGLLCKNTSKRFSVRDALKHEWISDYEHKANDINILDRIKVFLKNFNYNNKLHKILVNACLEEIHEDEKKIIIKAFHNIDAEKKGNIDESDLCKYLVLNSNINKKYYYGKPSQHAKHIFNVIENQTNIGPKIGKSKSIPIHEFVKDISDTVDMKMDMHNDSDSSQELIVDGNNNISVNTFKKIMRKSQKKYPINNIVKELDPDDSGYISFQSISKFSKTIKTISYDGMGSVDTYGNDT
eukprot:268313_1